MEKTRESLDNNAKRHAKNCLEREKAIPPQLPPELVSFPLLPPLARLPLFPLHLRDPKDLKTIKFTCSAVLSGLETKSISFHLNIHPSAFRHLSCHKPHWIKGSNHPHFPLVAPERFYAAPGGPNQPWWSLPASDSTHCCWHRKLVVLQCLWR